MSDTKLVRRHGFLALCDFVAPLSDWVWHAGSASILRVNALDVQPLIRWSFITTANSLRLMSSSSLSFLQ